MPLRLAARLIAGMPLTKVQTKLKAAHALLNMGVNTSILKQRNAHNTTPATIGNANAAGIPIFQHKKNYKMTTNELRALLKAVKGDFALSQLIKQKLKEHVKGYNVEHDITKNPAGELKEAAIGLLLDDPYERFNESPKGWDLELWGRMCFKPYPTRMVIAASMLISEANRNKHASFNL